MYILNIITLSRFVISMHLSIWDKINLQTLLSWVTIKMFPLLLFISPLISITRLANFVFIIWSDILLSQLAFCIIIVSYRLTWKTPCHGIITTKRIINTREWYAAFYYSQSGEEKKRPRKIPIIRWTELLWPGYKKRLSFVKLTLTSI